MNTDSFLDEFEADTGFLRVGQTTAQTTTQMNEQKNVQESNSFVHPPYTGVQIASWCGVSEATIRNRWFEWIQRVAPAAVLKEGKGYSELARSLFLEFKSIPQNKRDEWVMDAKARYSQEWGSVGIIEGELVPDEVGGALANLQQGNQDLAMQLAQEMEEAIAFSDQLDDIEADFSAAELEEMKMQGALRGVKRFKIMKQAEIQTFTQLRQKGTQSNG